jgi:hypothetical protein
MPEGEQKSHFPAWDEQDRRHDMAWINENLHVFWPIAQAAYGLVGRGAIVTDLTVDLKTDGHPFAYCNQGAIESIGDADAMRMVEQYEPDWQFVTVLFKAEGRMSTYRIGVYNSAPDGR